MDKNKKNLFYSSFVFTSLLILWPALAVISIPEGTPNEQLLSVNESFTMYGINFLVAMFIAPALLWMLKGLYPFFSGNLPKRWLSMAIFFFILYFILITLSYGSQVFYLPWIIDSYPQPGIMKWFFYDSESIAYLFNQSGYLSWSIGTFFFVIPVISKQQGILLIALIIFLLSALLQTIASAGTFLEIETLAKLTFYSGILLFPAGVLLIIFSTKNPGRIIP